MSNPQDNRPSESEQRTLWRLTPLQICQQFEEDWESGKGQRAEDVSFLRAVSLDDLDPLVFGLLQREMAYREQNGDPLTADELRSRLPDDKPIVEALLSENMSLHQITSALRDYECLERIPGGPIGGAYKIRHIHTHQIRFVRRIPEFFINQASLRANKDAAEVQHLFHRNLAAPIELIENAGAIFVVTELLEGMTLAELVNQRHPIPIPVACEIIKQAALGLNNIHSYFRVHEDVRPANILIGTAGRDAGVVKLGGVPGGLIDERQGRFALWSESALYNALEYLSPEILAGRSQLDMNSDLYGLGVTLRNTLVGDHQIASDMSLRNTRGGRRNQNPDAPTLCQLRPDAPPKLEAIIAAMTASDPDERLACSKEYIDIISEYADETEFKSWLDDQALQPRKVLTIQKQNDDQEATDKPSTSQVEPSPQPTPATIVPSTVRPETSVGDLPMEKALVEHPLKRRRRGLVTASLALVVTALLTVGGWSAWNYFTAAPTPQTIPDWAQNLTELPGPNGDWWFEEIPWYTPGVRQELAHRIATGDPSIDLAAIASVAEDLRSYPDKETVDRLEAIVLKLVKTVPDEQSLIVRQILEVDPEKHSVGDLKEEYQDILSDLDASPVDTPAKLHLRATLLSASSRYDEAAETYQQALQMYKTLSGENSELESLYALCAADYGKLLASYDRNYKKANVYFRLASNTARTTPLKVYSLCEMADSFRRWERHQNASETLMEATRLMVDESSMLDQHPLKALVHETSAWTALDSWRLTDAMNDFGAAKAIRIKHRNDKNPRSWRSILWIEQGEAMTSHFQGDQSAAQTRYKKLLDQIKNSLVGVITQSLPEQQRTELSARLPNINERLADCYLFGAAPDHEQACYYLNQAIVATEGSSFDAERLWPHILALKFKYAMALTLSGENELASSEFTKANRLISLRQESSGISDGQKAIYEPMQKVAHAIMHINAAEETERQAAIRELTTFYSSASAKVTRKNVDLVLFVSEELLNPNRIDADNVERIARRLRDVGIQLTSASNEKPINVYLNRYCTNAKRALESIGDGSEPDNESVFDFLSGVVNVAGSQPENLSRGISRIPLDPETGKPKGSRLHVLTVGVSDYTNHPTLGLGYAADDAEALFDAYQVLCKNDNPSATSQGLFQKGDFRILKDQEATKTSIIEAIDQMSRLASKEDLFIVSLAGHGTLNEQNQFFFLPTDYREESLQASAIWIDELRNMMGGGKSNSILVLDACHSGAATTVGVRASAGQDVHNALHRFTSSQKGLVVLAASRSDEKAFENQKFGHGVLTLALLEALRGDYEPEALTNFREYPQLPRPQNTKGLITLADINYYVEARVQFLTEGKQRAVTTRTGGDLSLSDIPIRFLQLETKP